MKYYLVREELANNYNKHDWYYIYEYDEPPIKDVDGAFVFLSFESVKVVGNIGDKDQAIKIAAFLTKEAYKEDLASEQ